MYVMTGLQTTHTDQAFSDKETCRDMDVSGMLVVIAKFYTLYIARPAHCVRSWCKITKNTLNRANFVKRKGK